MTGDTPDEATEPDAGPDTEPTEVVEVDESALPNPDEYRDDAEVEVPDDPVPPPALPDVEAAREAAEGDVTSPPPRDDQTPPDDPNAAENAT